MSESQPIAKKGFSIDWLVKGSLTRIGDIFDRLTGRGWKPSSSLATSELIERMKSMMDAEVRENENNQKYVPHIIKLKMQWDKFSTDSAEAIGKLENEFLIAAVDHINDKHYFTYAPLAIEVKPDYFTSGVRLFLSFDKLEGDGTDAELDVTLDNLKSSDLLQEVEAVPHKHSGQLRLSFVADGKPVTRDIAVEEGKRLSVGRTEENDVAINDQSISKAHASLLLNKDGKLIVADTGSTNGTFVRGERISYGKAVEIATRDSLMFGLVKVDLSLVQTAVPELAATESYKVGDIEFKSWPSVEGPKPAPATPEAAVSPETTQAPPQTALPPTVAAISIKKESLRPNDKPEASPAVAPQPGLSEVRVEIDREKQDWEV